MKITANRVPRIQTRVDPFATFYRFDLPQSRGPGRVVGSDGSAGCYAPLLKTVPVLRFAMRPHLACQPRNEDEKLIRAIEK